ncbi:hypothetical protein [Methylobacterium sp. E-046]|uniref:hypothetical protein n=1 Tax=Methylobacterium sp. E-046 TaxID=2836576 RepID=UPI001FBA47C9|nr:hypothetical protein [Methylobacterium sp. E-046]MCJ2099118.1 hypothetical protein [Methylobacterium sp. E-046]
MSRFLGKNRRKYLGIFLGALFVQAGAVVIGIFEEESYRNAVSGYLYAFFGSVVDDESEQQATFQSMMIILSGITMLYFVQIMRRNNPHAGSSRHPRPDM